MRLANGCFYDEDLFVLTEYPIDKIPLESYERIDKHCSLDLIELMLAFGFNLVLKGGYKLYSIFEDKYNLNERGESSFHFSVNTGYFERGLEYIIDVNDEDLMKDSPMLAITDFDKAMLGLLHASYLGIVCDVSSEGFDSREFFYACLSLFVKAQSYQFQSGKALRNNGSRSDMNALLLALWGFVDNGDSFFLSYFDRVGKGAFTKLKKEEKEGLRSIIEYRGSIRRAVRLSREREEEYIQDPEISNKWNACIDYFNQLSHDENKMLNFMRETGDLLEKKKLARKYLEKIDKPNTIVTDSNFTPTELYESLEERIVKAPNYNWIRTGNGELVYLTPAFAVLTNYPYTFNTVIIAYRLFMISRDKESLRMLTKTLEIYVRKNLSEVPMSLYDDEFISYEESLIEVGNLIVSFYDEHKTIIDGLSFDRIQTEATLSGLQFDRDIELYAYEDDLKSDAAIGRVIEEVSDSEAVSTFVKSLAERMLANDFKDMRNHLFVKRIKKELMDLYIPRLTEKMPANVDNRNIEIGRRMILSINAIYILENVIDTIIDSDRFEIGNIDEIKKQRNSLYNLETLLVNKAYISPDLLFSDEEGVNMHQYRKQIGIDIREMENRYSNLINHDLLDIACKTIEDIKNANDSDLIISIKTRFKETIDAYPKTGINSEVLEIIDQVSDMISEFLISQEKDTSEFEAEKDRICSVVGERYVRLPAEAILSLTTAELLYSQYATEKYAQIGFDYSSVSALYYQAVEAMYNKLLWEPYSGLLNRKKYKKDWFGYLYSNNNLPKEFLGFLPMEDRQYYLSKTYIKSSLTMGTFHSLLSCVRESKDEVIRFVEYMDSYFGRNMVSDSRETYLDYSNKIKKLSEQIEEATPRRNNASHGVKRISKEECQVDREMVLYNLDSTRNNALGIICLFLSLYND